MLSTNQLHVHENILAGDPPHVIFKAPTIMYEPGDFIFKTLMNQDHHIHKFGPVKAKSTHSTAQQHARRSLINQATNTALTGDVMVALTTRTLPFSTQVAHYFVIGDLNLSREIAMRKYVNGRRAIILKTHIQTSVHDPLITTKTRIYVSLYC